MKTYDSIIDLLQMEGPGLADYVSADQLTQLICGTLAPATIADAYLNDLAHSESATVATDDAQTRTDLLMWIRWEIEAAIAFRAEEAQANLIEHNLGVLRSMATAEKRLKGLIHIGKVESAQRAIAVGATKAAVADALNVSRPTLDAWLNRS